MGENWKNIDPWNKLKIRYDGPNKDKLKEKNRQFWNGPVRIENKR